MANSVKNDHHYYASTAYGWATAGTRDEAIKKVIRDIGVSTLKRHKPNGGVKAVVCRVDLPEAAHYTISDHLPNKITKEDGVNELRKGEAAPITEIEYVRITSMTGKTVPLKDD